MTDEEMLLSLCTSSVVAVIMKRRQKRRKTRKIWTREWLRNRTIFGAYYTLLAKLRNLDISSYRNFLRMDVTSFNVHHVHSNSNSADFNSSAAMLIWPRNHVTPNSKNDWFKPFNSRQLVERNRAKFYFRSTTFNNFQHVETHFNVQHHMIHCKHLFNSGYHICCSTNVEPCIIGLRYNESREKIPNNLKEPCQDQKPQFLRQKSFPST